MATTLAVSSLNGGIKFDFSNDTPLVPLSVSPAGLSLNLSFADGTGAGQADRIHVGRRTLAGAANESIDLAGGTIVDPLGTLVTFARIKAMIVLLQPSPAAAFLRLGGAPTNAFVNWVGDPTDKVVVRNGPQGGFLVLACGDATGYPVTAGTGDLLKIENGDPTLTATFDLILAGCSA